MFLSWVLPSLWILLIVVPYDVDAPRPKELVAELIAPLTGTAGVSSCDQPLRNECFCILLPLAHPNEPTVRNSFLNRRQVIERALDTSYAFDPVTINKPFLEEPLIASTHHPEKRVALFITVYIGGRLAAGDGGCSRYPPSP